MEWISDPTIWAGLTTLIVLEIVLGIDNVIFINILTEKLPAQKQDRARITGLSLALIMRIVLLCFTGWLMTLKTPLFSVMQFNFSTKDLIILGGGLFLVFKATMELNDRLEGKDHDDQKQKKTSNSLVVIAQIVVLDAVFSVDAIITATGIANDNIPVMLIAVTIAMILMMFASKPLAKFVNAHPTIVILCLSFLLMIGFSLIAEGFGVNIPKVYLYFAIGFSIVIEFFNQVALFNREKMMRKKPLRQRTADAILTLLKGEIDEDDGNVHTIDHIADAQNTDAFKNQELIMVERVFSLSQRSISSVMTSRQDAEMINISNESDDVLNALLKNQHSRVLVIDDDSADEPLGIIEIRDFFKILLNNKHDFNSINYAELIKQPLIFLETISLLVALDHFKAEKTHFALVVDEFGAMQGIVSMTDVMEAIAGEFPEHNQDIDVRHDIKQLDDKNWLVNGYVPLDELVHYIDLPLEDKREYHTIAGLLIEQLQDLPKEGESLIIENYRFEVQSVENHRIVKIKVTQLS